MLFRTVLYVRYCKNNFLYDFAGFGVEGMKVYIDVLVMENIVMNYLILLLTAKFMRHKPSHLRLFLGLWQGGICGCTAFDAQFESILHHVG